MSATSGGCGDGSGMSVGVGAGVAGTAIGMVAENAVRAKTPEMQAATSQQGALPGSFSSVIERVSPAVVSIQVTQDTADASAQLDFSGRPGTPEGMEEFLKRFFGDDWSKRFGN